MFTVFVLKANILTITGEDVNNISTNCKGTGAPLDDTHFPKQNTWILTSFDLNLF